MTKSAKSAAKPASVGNEEPVVSVREETRIAAAARDFAQRAAETIKDRAETVNSGAEKATNLIETAVAASTARAAEASRAIQSAVHQDVQAAIALAEKIASSKSVAEAAQAHVEFLNERGQVGLARMTSAAEFLGKTLESSAKSAQEGIAKLSGWMSRAA